MPSNYLFFETIKALRLRHRAFIRFSVFGTPEEKLALVFDLLLEIVVVLHTHPSTCPPIQPSIYPSIHLPSIHPSIQLSIHPSVPASYLLTFIVLVKYLVSLTSNMDSMAGRRLVQRLITSPHLATTLQLATEDSRPINRETGGLEELKTDPLNQQRQDSCKETIHKELSLLRSLKSLVKRSHF